jgi:hypothetical protein
MSSDLQRFLRAVRTLEKLWHKYPEEAFLEALGRYATTKQESEVWGVGTFLDDIGRELSKRCVRLCCRQCGKEIEDDVRYDGGYARADAQYCGAACRQRAYRSRVTASTPNRERKRNGNGIALRLGQRSRQRAVTTPGDPDDGGAP